MEEPPAKRARRIDSSAMWDKNESSAPNSPRSRDDDRDLRHKGGDGSGRQDNNDRRRDDRRPRSGSRERHDRRRDRSRSKERSHRDRARDSRTDRDRDGASRRERDRSRSRDRHRGAKGVYHLQRSTNLTRSLLGTDHVPLRSDYTRRRSRSRSPARNGTSTVTRTRSPPRGPRNDRDRPPQRDRDKEAGKSVATSRATKEDAEDMQLDAKAPTNGTTVSDEDDEDSLLKNMMGFSTFKSTQNTKVPGNNVYGVRKEKKTEYRQYMNRVGGFNRPLSPSR